MEMIQVEEGLIISLQFTAFNIESDSTCRYDHLTITDGDGTTLMEKSCGTTIPADIRSTSNIVKLVFSTDSSYSYSGWSVNWSAVTPGECQQHLWMFLVNFSIIDDALKKPDAFNPSKPGSASLSSFESSHFIAKSILIPLLIDPHQGQKNKFWTKWS